MLAYNTSTHAWGISAEWQNAFKPMGKTRFQLHGGGFVERDFMWQQSIFFVVKETGELVFVKIPYKRRRFHMVLAKPSNESEHIG